jgi:predicted RNA methylase
VNKLNIKTPFHIDDTQYKIVNVTGKPFDGTLTNEMGLFYLRKEGDDKLGEVVKNILNKTCIEAFINRYADKSAFGKARLIPRIFYVFNKKDWPFSNNGQGYDKQFHNHINRKYRNNEVSFYFPKDNLGNTERLSENFNESMFDILTKELFSLLKVNGYNKDLKAFKFRSKFQEEKIIELVSIVLKHYKCLFNMWGGFGKTTCTPKAIADIVTKLPKNLRSNIVLFTSCIIDTLDPVIDAINHWDYGVKFKVFTNDDIKNGNVKTIVKRIKKAIAEDYIIVLVFSVQNIRFDDKDIIETDEVLLRRKFRFLNQLELDLWIRDEYHKEYHGIKTSKILSNIKASYIIDMTATTCKLRMLYGNEYTDKQILKCDMLDSQQLKAQGHLDFQKLPKLVITQFDYQSATVPESLRNIMTSEEGMTSKKLFEYKNNKFTHAAQIIDWLKLRYNGIDGIKVSNKKNPNAKYNDKNLIREMITIPEGNTIDGGVQIKLLEIQKIANRSGCTVNFYIPNDLFKINKIIGNEKTLNCWDEKAAKEGKFGWVIFTHEQLTVGTDTPQLSSQVLFNKITAIDLFGQTIQRPAREYKEKDIATITLASPDQTCSVSSMKYQMIKERSDDSTKQKEMWDMVMPINVKEIPVDFQTGMQNYLREFGKEITNNISSSSFITNKFPDLSLMLKDIPFDERMGDKSSKAKLSLTGNNGAETYQPNVKSGTVKKLDKKIIDKRIETINVMLIESLSIGKFENYTELKDCFSHNKKSLGYLYFGDKDIDLIQTAFKHGEFYEAYNFWYKERYKDAECINQKYKKDMGLVYVPEKLADEMVEMLHLKQPKVVGVPNALNGAFAFSLRKKYPSTRIVCLETFPYYVEYLKRSGFEVYDINKLSIKELQDMKFDAIVMNPPYKKFEHLEFLDKAMKISFIVIPILPTRFILNQKDTKRTNIEIKVLSNLQTHVSYVKLLNGNKYFPGIQFTAPLCIMNINMNKIYDNIKIEDEMSDKTYKIKSLKELNQYSYYDGYERLKNKILSYCGKNDNLYNHQNKTKNNWYINLNAIRGHTVNTIGTFVPRDEKSEKMITKQIWFSFATKSEADNFISYLKTDFARFSLSIYKTGLHLRTGELKSVSWLDFTKKYTDADLYKMFNITKDEIKFIESIISKYYEN